MDLFPFFFLFFVSLDDVEIVEELEDADDDELVSEELDTIDYELELIDKKFISSD